MRILIAHNRYQLGGGEETVVANERRLLEEHGHEVEYLGVDNESIRGVMGKMIAAGQAFYSIDSAHRITGLIDRFHPDVVHVHNYLATLSPSVFFAAKRRKIPVVFTLHNYRLLCANAQLFRDGRPCEECIDQRSFLPGAYHACYRNSRSGSAILGGSMALHAALGTWQQKVDRYIALTAFVAEKMAGLRVPVDRIRIKPNFTFDSGQGSGGGGFALYAGRMAPEKGIQTLIEADAKGLLPMPVHLVGDGPLLQMVREAALREGSRLKPLGLLPHDEVQGLMRRATVLVVPSIWYEPFGMVCVEAFAAGLPILCSRIGGLPEIVEDGVSGRLFPPGDADGLASALRLFIEGSSELIDMRLAARFRYETLYSEERNYGLLMGIYQELTPHLKDECPVGPVSANATPKIQMNL